MDEMEKLIALLIKYLELQISEKSLWDFLIMYVLPSISSIVLVGTAVSGFLKYRSSKNREIYEKILYGVYAPLYQYFVKQEIYCAIHLPERDYKETPIIELFNRKEITKYGNDNFEKKEEITTLFDLSRKEFLKVRDDINTGLASQELLTLLNMYEVLIFMEEKYGKNTNEFLQATLIKGDVENALREEVFTGYQNYYKKLGLDKNRELNLWKLSKDQIHFNVLKSKEELKRAKDRMIELENKSK